MRGKINEHDIVTKKVLSKKTYAVDFLANTLPQEIISKLDFSKLKIEKGDFIDSMSIEVVSRITGLPFKEIEKLERR